MNLKSALSTASAFLLGTAAMAQQPANPTPGCKATPAELEANRKVAMEFFLQGADRVALADPQL
jgi:hypothetical protein